MTGDKTKLKAKDMKQSRLADKFKLIPSTATPPASISASYWADCSKDSHAPVCFDEWPYLIQGERKWTELDEREKTKNDGTKH